MWIVEIFKFLFFYPAHQKATGYRFASCLYYSASAFSPLK